MVRLHEGILAQPPTRSLFAAMGQNGGMGWPYFRTKPSTTNWDDWGCLQSCQFC